MSIRCAFDGHTQRASICQGEATSFFKTYKGTLWPLCPMCSDRHRDLVLKVAQRGDINAAIAAGATFDIPLDDPKALAAWKAQDPEKIQKVIRAVDVMWADQGS